MPKVAHAILAFTREIPTGLAQLSFTVMVSVFSVFYDDRNFGIRTYHPAGPVRILKWRDHGHFSLVLLAKSFSLISGLCGFTGDDDSHGSNQRRRESGENFIVDTGR